MKLAVTVQAPVIGAFNVSNLLAVLGGLMTLGHSAVSAAAALASSIALPSVLHEAFHIASSGRPGPVVVDIPKDIQFAKGNYFRPNTFHHQGYKPRLQGDPVRIIPGQTVVTWMLSWASSARSESESPASANLLAQ